MLIAGINFATHYLVMSQRSWRPYLADPEAGWFLLVTLGLSLIHIYAVLADVPCTDSGVVRRNPDIKWLRREEDVAAFARTQSAILDALWQVVRPGGKLRYATCSLFPQDNGEQISRFLARTSDALQRHEELLLPDAEHDGFFYCLLEKAV